MNYRRLSRFCFLTVAALLLAAAPPAARAAAARELGFDRPGDLPEVKANADEPLVIEKLRFTDCRTAQGFTTAPIDGRADTRLSIPSSRPYPMVIWDAQSGIGSFNSGSGVRMRLADRRGFNFVRVLGDFQGTLFLDPNPPRARPGALVLAPDSGPQEADRRACSPIAQPSPGGATAISQGREPLVGGRTDDLALEGRKALRDVSASGVRVGSDLSPFQGSVIGAALDQGLAPLANRCRPFGAGWLPVAKSSGGESESEFLKRLRVADVVTEGGFFRKQLVGAAVTSAVRFSGSSGGTLADVSFYRVGAPDKPYRASEEWWVAAPVATPVAIAPFLEARFGAADRAVLGATTATPDGGTVALPARTFVHVAVGPLSFEEGLTALELDLKLDGIPSHCPLTVRVQDPLNGRQELMAADVSVSGAGHAHLILDFPNQVLPEGAILWLSVAARDGGRIVTGKDGSRVRLLAVPRDSTLPEALAYRKLFLKGVFCRLGETAADDRLVRLTGVGRPQKERQKAKGKRQKAKGRGPSGFCRLVAQRHRPFAFCLSSYRPSERSEDTLLELYTTLAECRWLGPDDAEVAGYERWLGIAPPDLPWELVRGMRYQSAPEVSGCRSRCCSVTRATIVDRKAMVRAGTAPSASAIPQTIPPSHSSARAAIFNVESVRFMADLSPAAAPADAY